MKVCSVCHGSHENSIACTGESFDDRDEIQRLAEDSIPGFLLNGLLTSSHSTRIYEAQETESGRSCVIRIVNSDEAATKRVLYEAKIATGLFHPGIADVYQAGQVDDGRSFVVSEAVNGRELREVLDNIGSPDLLTTIEIIRQAAESLHALHLAGLIHGAINPRNIVLSMCPDGPPSVRIRHPDFGRISQRSIISNRFLIDSEIDSLRYFAPEQCSGDEASSQSDIYSLGVVFYEMLSGVPPFDAQTAVALIHQQRNQQPPEVRIENFNLRMLVTHALTEALQKHARLRQASADLFARQLRHIEQLATHSSTPPPAGAVRVSPPAAMPVVVPSPNKIEPTAVAVKKTEAPKAAVVRLDEGVPVGAAVARENENERIENTKQPSEPKTATILETAEPEKLVSAGSAIEKISVPKPIFVTPRSRLKLWKKKLRSLAERVGPETKVVTPSIFESADPAAVKRKSSLPKAVDAVEPVKRRKIEWETPDDDIPFEAAVLEVVEKERHLAPPTVAAAKGESAVSTEVPEAPPVTEKPVRVQPARREERPPAATHPKAKRIEDSQRKNAPGRPVTPTPVARVSSREKAPEPALAAPARIVSRPAAVETIDPKDKVSKSTANRSGLGFKVNLADLEEITLVRPPSKRIRIDWERAVPRPDLSNIQPRRPQEKAREISFAPTILGDAPRRRLQMPARSEGMFSAFDSASFPGIYNRRSAVLGGGLLALMVLLLFGSGSVTEVFQASTAADSVTASASMPIVTQPISEPPSQVASTVTQKTLHGSEAPNLEKPVPETISITEKDSRPASRPATSDVAADSKTKVPNKSRAASSDEGSRTQERKTDDRTRSREKPVTPAFKPATFTRPRIVKTEP